MNVVIIGCGRLGVRVAKKMSEEKDTNVIVMDKNTDSLNRLGKEFTGKVLQGDGTNMEAYVEIMKGIPDIFLALTAHDNTNIMAAEIASHKYKVKTVIARVDDPIRAKAFEELGIETFCPTTLSEKMIGDMLKAGEEKEAEDVE
jgi:trk system potassium uptake protein TrkA